MAPPDVVMGKAVRVVSSGLPGGFVPPSASIDRVDRGNRGRLTEPQRVEIRDAVNGGPLTKEMAARFAERFGVSVKTIRRALTPHTPRDES